MVTATQKAAAVKKAEEDGGYRPSVMTPGTGIASAEAKRGVLSKKGSNIFKPRSKRYFIAEGHYLK